MGDLSLISRKHFITGYQNAETERRWLGIGDRIILSMLDVLNLLQLYFRLKKKSQWFKFYSLLWEKCGRSIIWNFFLQVWKEYFPVFLNAISGFFLGNIGSHHYSRKDQLTQIYPLPKRFDTMVKIGNFFSGLFPSSQSSRFKAAVITDYRRKWNNSMYVKIKKQKYQNRGSKTIRATFRLEIARDFWCGLSVCVCAFVPHLSILLCLQVTMLNIYFYM